MGLFSGSNRSSRLAQIDASVKAEEERKRQDEILAQQQSMHQQELKLSKRALNQQKAQNAAITDALAKQEAIANRPDPAPAPPAAVMVTGGTAADAASQDDSAIDVRRRGRGALRIDMNAPQTGGSQTGLNVPRG